MIFINVKYCLQIPYFNSIGYIQINTSNYGVEQIKVFKKIFDILFHAALQVVNLTPKRNNSEYSLWIMQADLQTSFLVVVYIHPHKSFIFEVNISIKPNNQNYFNIIQNATHVSLRSNLTGGTHLSSYILVSIHKINWFWKWFSLRAKVAFAYFLLIVMLNFETRQQTSYKKSYFGIQFRTWNKFDPSNNKQ